MNDVNLDTLEHLNCPHCGNPLREPLPEAFSKAQCEQCRMASVIPGKFGQFLLYKELGESVTSIVFDAFDPKLGRNVTLKILNYVLSKNPELVEAFQHEALAAAALNSTYVLKVYEFGIHNHQPFMVLEHIEGKFLHEVIQQNTLSEIRILEIMDGIVQGLQDMHEQGIMHGDVMPRNILIHTDGSPRISDFGLARFNGQNAENSVNHPWENWSSPYYMPPERILGQKEDFRGDFYSLGTTLYNLLTGELPFFDLDESIVLKRKVEEDPPDPRTIQPEISDGMAEITGYLLQRNPEDRPTDYAEVKSLLSKIKARMPRTEKQIPEPDLIPDYHQNTRKKKEPFAWFVFLVLLGILLAMLISLVSREETELPLIPESTPTAALPTSEPTPSPTQSPTPFPTPTPLPEPSPTPTPAAPKTESLESLLQSSERLFFLRSDLTEEISAGRVATWNDPQTGKMIFVQKTPELQPRRVENALGDTVLRFSNSQMTSSLQPNTMEAFTLLTVISIPASAVDEPSSVIMGIDPKAANTRKFYIKKHADLTAGFLFGTDKGSAILTLPKDERAKPFLIGFIRSPEGDRAFLGSTTTLLSGSAPIHSAPQENTFQGFQLGGLEPGTDFFNGWFGDFIFYSKALTLQEFDVVADHLHKKFTLQP